MNRCILIIIAALTINSSFAQSDFIQLKKNNKVINSWFKGNDIYVQLKSGNWINAVIYKIQDDSLYLRPYNVYYYTSRSGINVADTAFFGIMTISYNNINAFPEQGHKSGIISKGHLFKLAGGAYLALNIINTLRLGEPVFGADNLPKIGIAAGVLAVGVVLGLTHKSTYIIGKKYHIEYISAKPS